jgi:Cu/Ag efflux protein CusF
MDILLRCAPSKTSAVDLEVPLMTMVFLWGEPVMAMQFKIAGEIEFVAECVSGKPTATALR